MGASGQREEGTRRSRCPARASSLRSSSFPAHDSPDGNTKETEFDRWLEWMEEREKGEREREKRAYNIKSVSFGNPTLSPKRKRKRWFLPSSRLLRTVLESRVEWWRLSSSRFGGRTLLSTLHSILFPSSFRPRFSLQLRRPSQKR